VDREGRPAPAVALGIACDVSEPSAVAALFEDLDRERLEPDVLVHCAGVARDGVLWKLDDESWSAVMRSNLDSAFFLLRASIPRMRRRGRGTVVLVSSINGERGKIGQANYSASKAGLIGLARTARGRPLRDPRQRGRARHGPDGDDGRPAGGGSAPVGRGGGARAHRRARRRRARDPVPVLGSLAARHGSGAASRWRPADRMNDARRTDMETTLERSERVLVRRLRPEDLGRVVALDAKVVGRERGKFFELVLRRNLSETGIEVSLAAELDGLFVGYLLARAYYGEFGMLEPVAVLETLGVHPDFRHQGVGAALLRQLAVNLRGLGLTRLRTEVDWDDLDLLGFFHREGFQPARRLVLELDLSAGPGQG
jgi:ribosomal protein S18 acetylase RimI-like enzyme